MFAGMCVQGKAKILSFMLVAREWEQMDIFMICIKASSVYLQLVEPSPSVSVYLLYITK